MHINEIVELFASLGIKLEVDEEGKMKFFDNELDKEMTAFYTNNPSLFIPPEDIEPLIPVSELVKRGGMISVTSYIKHIKFSLDNPRVDRKKDDNSIVINSIEFSMRTGNKVDNYRVQLDDMSTKSGIQIYSYTNDGKHTNVGIYNEGYISFDADGKYGEFDTEFDERYDLNSSEMLEIFNSITLIQIFANYYGKLYPNLLEVTNRLVQKKNSNIHK